MNSMCGSAALLGTLFTVACRGGSAPAAGVPARPAVSEVTPADAHDGSVKLLPENLRQISVDQARTTDGAEALSATGKVQFNEDHIARILPPVGGQVWQLHVQVGDRVHAGETLFMLNSRDVAAAFAEHEAAHRDADLAEKTYAMTQDLFEHQAASKLSLQQAENELAKATTRVQQNEQVLRVLGIDTPDDGRSTAAARVPVRSPIAGVVTQRAVTEGQFVEPQAEPLLTIADLSTVWVLADAFEHDLPRIAVGQTAEVTTAAYVDERFVARVSQIGNVVDPETHTVSVRFLVSNPSGHLKPGMFATAKLDLHDGPRSLTVPATAVFVEEGKSYSYVQTSDRTFARREVKTAGGGRDRVRVVSGLTAGEKIVTDGVLLLRQQEEQGQQ